MSNNEKESQHRQLFETYLNTDVKNNSKIISRDDLVKIKYYLETGDSSKLGYNLKRRTIPITVKRSS